MRLLFDQNLSRTLVGDLRDEFPESQHVPALDLDTATDREIWDDAGEHGYVDASKDSDFRPLAFLHGPPPKVVWLRVGNASTGRRRINGSATHPRVGNASTAAVLRIPRDHAQVVDALALSEDEALLVLPGTPGRPCRNRHVQHLCDIADPVESASWVLNDETPAVAGVSHQSG